MEANTKQYTEEEARAALTLLFLAGSLDSAELEPRIVGNSPTTTNTGNDSPLSEDDLIIDESELLQDEEDDTLTPEDQPQPEEGEEDEPEENKDLYNFLATCNMDSLIGRMTKVALSTIDFNNPEENSRFNEEGRLRQRLELFINEEEVQGTKYHASMKRFYASAADRSLSKQINRDKNNTASRLSRIRLRNAEQNLKVEAQKLDEANMARRMKKAVLLNYVQVLHKTLKLKPMDFNRPVKEILGDYGVDWEKVKRAADKVDVDVVVD